MTHSNLSRVGLVLALAVLLTCTLFPAYYMLLTSLKPDETLLAQPPAFLFAPVLDHYATLLHDGDFPRYYANSVIVAVGATALAVFLGSMMAYIMATIPFRLSPLAFFFILLPRTFPPITTLIPIFVVVRWLGLMDTVATLILFETAARLPLVVWIMRSFIRTIPFPLLEASFVDGCTPAQAFFRIVVPLAAPGLAAVGIISFIDTWNAFLMPLVLTNFNAVTAPVGMMSYINSEEQLIWGVIAAGGVLTILPVLILAFTLNRFLLQGLTAGAVK